MRRSLLAIVGPTATGKTKLALEIARHWHHQTLIISADSRQVYRGMEIGTGVDIPVGFSQEGADWVSAEGQVVLTGVAMIPPTQSWSAYDFVRFARAKVEQAWAANTFPIVVGGTGLYHQLFLGTEGFHLPAENSSHAAQPMPAVRDRAAELNVAELQRWALELDEPRFNQLNQSDRSNPRRLVRLIEKILWQQQAPVKTEELDEFSPPKHQYTIGLTAPKEFLEPIIRQRVADRIQQGVLAETEKLMADYSDQEWRLPAFSATGYRELRSYLEGQVELAAATERWIQREIQYAKRQLTWWKKFGHATWFDVSQADGLESAIKRGSKWVTTFTDPEK